MNYLGRQRGMGFLGFMFTAFAVVSGITLVVKIAPSYIEHGAINKLFSAIANDPAMEKGSLKDIRDSFSRRAQIDNLSSVKAEDIEVDMTSGKPVLTASYFVKIPLVANVSAYLDFKCESK